MTVEKVPSRSRLFSSLHIGNVFSRIEAQVYGAIEQNREDLFLERADETIFSELDLMKVSRNVRSLISFISNEQSLMKLRYLESSSSEAKPQVKRAVYPESVSQSPEYQHRHQLMTELAHLIDAERFAVANDKLLEARQWYNQLGNTVPLTFRVQVNVELHLYAAKLAEVISSRVTQKSARLHFKAQALSELISAYQRDLWMPEKDMLLRLVGQFDPELAVVLAEKMTDFDEAIKLLHDKSSL